MFLRSDAGEVFHAYSTFGRGVEAMMGTYQLLDLAPRGRHETNPAYPMDWVRHHDRYAPSLPAAGSAAAPAAQAPQPSTAHTAPGGCCSTRS